MGGRFQRARSPEHKQQRRDAIVEAAAGLLAEHGLDGVTLTAIAKEAGLSKSNLYRYFESREHILLDLMQDDWTEWVEAIETALRPRAEGPWTAEEVARVMVQVTVERPRLCELISVLNSVLERNVSEEAVLAFKTRGIGLAMRHVVAMHAALPNLSLESAIAFMKGMFVLLAGLWPAAHPPEVVRKVMQRPEFQPMCVDYQDTLHTSAAAMLRGFVGR